jgi:hypothetical protein
MAHFHKRPTRASLWLLCLYLAIVKEPVAPRPAGPDNKKPGDERRVSPPHHWGRTYAMLDRLFILYSSETSVVISSDLGYAAPYPWQTIGKYTTSSRAVK